MKALFKDIEKEICNSILSSKKKILVAVAWFTNEKIFNALNEVINAKKIKVEIIIIPDEINFSYLSLDFNYYMRNGGKLYTYSNDKNLHHKFAIIDDLLYTGSYNWTFYAEHRNRENIVIIDDSTIIKIYENEFKKLKLESKKLINVNEVELLDSINLFNKAHFQEEEIKKKYQYKIEKNSNVIELIQILEKLIELKNYDFVIDNISTLDIDKTEYFKIIDKIQNKNKIYINNYIKNNISKKRLIQEYYEDTINSKVESTNESYLSICNKLSSSIRSKDYLYAIRLANNMMSKYGNKPSIRIYLGDVKMEIGDIIGAQKEYEKAINNCKLVNRVTNFIYFNYKTMYHYYPIGEIYIKLKNYKLAKQNLFKALDIYKQLKKQNKTSNELENNYKIIEKRLNDIEKYIT